MGDKEEENYIAGRTRSGPCKPVSGEPCCEKTKSTCKSFCRAVEKRGVQKSRRIDRKWSALPENWLES